MKGFFVITMLFVIAFVLVGCGMPGDAESAITKEGYYSFEDASKAKYPENWLPRGADEAWCGRAITHNNLDDSEMCVELIITRKGDLWQIHSFPSNGAEDSLKLIGCELPSGFFSCIIPGIK